MNPRFPRYERGEMPLLYPAIYSADFPPTVGGPGRTVHGPLSFHPFTAPIVTGGAESHRGTCSGHGQRSWGFTVPNAHRGGNNLKNLRGRRKRAVFPLTRLSDRRQIAPAAQVWPRRDFTDLIDFPVPVITGLADPVVSVDVPFDFLNSGVFHGLLFRVL